MKICTSPQHKGTENTHTRSVAQASTHRTFLMFVLYDKACTLNEMAR